MLHNYNFIKMSENNKSGKGLILRTKASNVTQLKQW